MIIILSNENDMSTSHVINWLLFYKQKFLRINDVKKIELLNYRTVNQSFTFKYNDIIIDSQEIIGYWYRRGYYENETYDFSKELRVNGFISKYLNVEKRVTLNFLIFLLENSVKNKIKGFFNPNINKLYQLFIAKQVGLVVPESYILSNGEGMKGDYITKSLDNVFDVIDEKISIINYTNKVKNENLSQNMYPSFIQECVNKKFEIRSFFLKGKLYSMAIFSQANNKTKVDFRHYDLETPNRNTPIPVSYTHLRAHETG
jgi:hypothetical protein